MNDYKGKLERKWILILGICNENRTLVRFVSFALRLSLKSTEKNDI